MTSLYDISIPVLTNIVKTTQSVLQKGEAWAKENNVKTTDLMARKIYDDMFPLTIQVIIVANVTKKTIERLTGTPHPDIEDFNKTLEELYAIIDQTLKELAAVKREDVVDGRESVQVSCMFFEKEYKATALEYVHGYAIPTVYFHLSIVYAILRGQGVPLGKWDYQTQFFKNFKLA